MVSALESAVCSGIAELADYILRSGQALSSNWELLLTSGLKSHIFEDLGAVDTDLYSSKQEYKSSKHLTTQESVTG